MAGDLGDLGFQGGTVGQTAVTKMAKIRHGFCHYSSHTFCPIWIQTMIYAMIHVDIQTRIHAIIQKRPLPRIVHGFKQQQKNNQGSMLGSNHGSKQ